MGRRTQEMHQGMDQAIEPQAEGIAAAKKCGKARRGAMGSREKTGLGDGRVREAKAPHGTLSCRAVAGSRPGPPQDGELRGRMPDQLPREVTSSTPSHGKKRKNVHT